MIKTGKVYFHFKSVTSTNDIAAELTAKTSPINGTAISADFQSAGRGQFDRKWLGTPGENIAVSVIFLPESLKIVDQFYLNKCVALSVLRCVSAYADESAKTEIKWPNDIILNGSKVAGILIQNILQGDRYKCSIIGIGINVLQTEWQGIEIKPTSIVLNTKMPPDKNEIIQNLFLQCDYFLQLLENKEFEKIDKMYHENMYRINQATNVMIKDVQECVLIKSVDKLGRICIEREGREAYFDYGVLKILYEI
jgi:BirA family biotin operon repressor/biotin-[acetyl-CoA-carboxylase] ligase